MQKEVGGELATTDAPADQLSALLETVRPEGSFARTLADWQEAGEPRLETGDYANLCCRGIAAQLINEAHVEFSGQTETIHPPEERFANRTNYKISGQLGTGHSIKLLPAWRDQLLIVPAVAVSPPPVSTNGNGLVNGNGNGNGNRNGNSNGASKPMAFMVPGTGVIYDESQSRFDTIVGDIHPTEPEHTRDLESLRVVDVLRHILKVHRSTNKQAK